MPDIDIDFTDTRRDEVIDYARKKYGEDRVAQIITFGTMAARVAIRDVGRALNMAYGFCDTLAKMVPFGFTLERTLNEIAEFKNLYETDPQVKRLIGYARRLEGVARHASTHACGVVITAGSLDDFTPRQHTSQSDLTVVSQYEMHAIEALGLLKMDFLGLRNLTTIESALKIIERTREKKVDLDTLPLDDKPSFKLMQQGLTTGLFQLESSGIRRYLMELKPTEFEDIIVMISLYRPGALDVGMVPHYIARKHGREEVAYLHPKLIPILERTHGIIVYQEQLTQIARDLAGFTYSEADTLRKAVGKKIKKLLQEQRAKLIDGMTKHGIKLTTAREIWTFIEPFARYGFNRSHGAAYALIAYQTAYLKAHFPVEFMAALMSAEAGDIERTATLVDECRAMKIEVLPPDINESFALFTAVGDKIRFGLSAIKNVGDNIVAEVIKERKARGAFESIGDFITRIAHRDLNKKSLESMIKAGVFDALGERNMLLQNLEYLLRSAREVQSHKDKGQTSLFDLSPAPVTFHTILRKAEAVSESTKLTWEKELLGMYVSSHPLVKFSAALKKQGVMTVAELLAKPRKIRTQVAGVVTTIKKINTRTNQPMLFVNLEDTTGKIECIVFPSTLEKNPVLWQEDRLLLVIGRCDTSRGSTKFICDNAQELSPN